MRRQTAVLCLAAIALVTGSLANSKTVKAKPDVVAAVKTVRISSDVSVPSEMFYQGRAETFALSGAIVAGDGRPPAPTDRKPKEQIMELLKTGQIDLRSILRAQFGKELQNAGPIVVVDSGDSDAEVKLKIETYGLGQRQGFSPILYPVIRIEAIMTRKDGTVIWQKSDYITPQNKENNIGHKEEEFAAEPELLRKTWENIAGIVSRYVVKTLYAPMK